MTLEKIREKVVVIRNIIENAKIEELEKSDIAYKAAKKELKDVSTALLFERTKRDKLAKIDDLHNNLAGEKIEDISDIRLRHAADAIEMDLE